jgi:hypothetical protein
MLKLDSRPYPLLSGQGDWIKHLSITVVIEDKKIIEALDSEHELRWSAGKGSWRVGNGRPQNDAEAELFG